MIAYKGFNPGLECRGYRFVMGLNITDEANCVQNGFHCAENPLDCLSYYSDMERSEYYLVNAGGDVDEDAIDSKISCTELTILRRLNKLEFFLHALAYMVDHPNRKWNSNVRKEIGQAKDGYVVVRGIDPKASGSQGDVLAFAKENPETGKIIQIAVTQVDGEKIAPNRWYNIDFMERSVMIT